MLQRIQATWSKWRESRSQYQLERALYKAGGHSTGAFSSAERAEGTNLASGVEGPRVEAPKGKAPAPTAE
jgi:hypothetical protein